jgi:glycerate 2-kinase
MVEVSEMLADNHLRPRDAAQLRRDALQIWQAGVDAVRPERLMPRWLRVENRSLLIGDNRPTVVPLDGVSRIAVVGAGKAGAAMALALETALGPELIAEKQLVGWVNVPADCAGDSGSACRRPPNVAGIRRPLSTQRIHLHPARPAGVNEPTAEGVAGSIEILRIVESLGPDDLCFCLISGGGSALMPAPVEGISLADKLAVTRHLSAAGANIEQLNAVRKQLSRIKGGRLAAACRAGRMISLIISDVLGDPLDVIASGPTVPDSSTPQDALAILEQFGAREAGIAPAVFAHLENAINSRGPTARGEGQENHPSVTNLILANNAAAVAAAAEEAARLGYTVETASAAHSEGQAEQVGRELAEEALAMRTSVDATTRRCFISGGEPVVKLVDPSRRGLGGRNQQLILAALLRLIDDGADGIAILSGGTDGEDGPTDAAGAVFDADVLAAAKRLKLDPAAYLARNDAYHFFEPLAALIKTGPTNTNVCDLRVLLAANSPLVAQPETLAWLSGKTSRKGAKARRMQKKNE